MKISSERWHGRRAIARGLIAGAYLIGSWLVVAQEKPADKSAGQAEASGTEYNNWITFGAGSTFIDGNDAAFKRRRQIPEGPFGGVEDFHWEQNVGKKGILQLDGRGIFDNHDYSIRVELSDPDQGFLRAGYREFRTWDDGSGGFFPRGTNNWFDLYDDELFVDRGEAWFEAGLTLPDKPVITFRYAHVFRNGQKDSTIWGDSNLTGGFGSRAFVPTFLTIDEKRDTFEGDVKHTLGNTDVSVGLRYEILDNNNSRNIRRRPGEVTAVGTALPADRYLTQKEGLDEDLFNVHGSTVTRFSEKVMVTVGGSFTTLDTDISGSRIYGSSYDPVYDPTFGRRQQRDEGFLDLSGGANVKQYVGNLNLMVTPLENLNLVGSLRIEKNAMHGLASFLETDVAGAPTFAAISNNIVNTASRDFLEVTEALEARYTGIKNWSFYARGQWSQTDGNQTENEIETDPTSPVTTLFRDTDWNRFTQKYTVGANWYPRSRLNFGAQYYYKIHEYDYDSASDSTVFSTTPPANTNNFYPAFLRDQDFTTHDMNFRVTWRPLATVSTVTRYDFQLSTVDTTGSYNTLGAGLASIQGAEITSHIISESISWTPLNRLYLQASASYSLDSTETPATDWLGTNRLVLYGANDFWNASGLVGYALDEKTDLQTQYIYYHADNYVDNSASSMPYGAGVEEHGVTATISRVLSKAVRVSLKYGFFRNREITYGGRNDYDAHLVLATLQYRF